MDDVGNVGFIDTHAEGVRCDHDAFAVVYEILLIPLTNRVLKSRVVYRRGKTRLTELFSDLFDGFSRGAIDDPRFILAFFQKGKQLVRFLFGADDEDAEPTSEASEGLFL